jgi:1-aminocyclopropane-1-carboxylate synthase
LGPYVHWVYALSKDFAVSGFRIGAAYTENPEITMPMQKLNDLCQISSQTQIWATGMLTRLHDTKHGNELWTTAFQRENHKRLLQRYKSVVKILDQFRIPFLPAQAGLFVWIDFSQFLIKSDDSTAASQERILYRKLIDFGLLLTPGNSMKNERPGFFRCVFTAISDDEFTIALKRLETFLQMTIQSKI